MCKKMKITETIKDFFNDQDVFITGCTGLAGKALVEKILRSCERVSNVFVLVRDLKNKSCVERLENLKSSRIFDRLREENPKALNKIIPIPGDLFEIGLGLSENSIKLLENVSIVYHVAATVRFDEPLKNSILLNVRGTREICNLMTKLKKLKIFVHVSTIYSNPYLSYVEEKIYPSKMDWKLAIKLAEDLDHERINALTPKIIFGFPNTYTFSKHLAEAVVNDYRDKISEIAIVRPSIVHCAGFEPYPGWYDNYNGLMGLITGVFTGVVRALYCNPNIVIDPVPLDDAVKLIVNCGWWKIYREEKDEKKISVFNVASRNIQPHSIQSMIDLSLTVDEKCAFNKCIWKPKFGVTSNIYYYYFRIYMYQVLPAILIDLLLRLFRQNPFMLKVQRRALTSQIVTQFFCFNEYSFQTDRALDMINECKHHPGFEVAQLMGKTQQEISEITLMGARRYLLNEDDSTIPAARRRLKMYAFNRI